MLLYFTDGMPVIRTSWYRLNFVHCLSLNRTHSGGSGWTISRLVPKFFKGFNGEIHEAITLYWNLRHSSCKWKASRGILIKRNYLMVSGVLWTHVVLFTVQCRVAGQAVWQDSRQLCGPVALDGGQTQGWGVHGESVRVWSVWCVTACLHSEWSGHVCMCVSWVCVRDGLSKFTLWLRLLLIQMIWRTR